MNIVILDDYQDAVRKLSCFASLAGHEVKVFNNNIKGAGQLSVRLRDAEALVLIRERTVINKALLEKLPKLKLISQTGKTGPHIDVAACSARNIAVAEGMDAPEAPAELTWALIMCAMRRVPQYVGMLKHGAWQQAGLKTSALPANFGLGQMLHGQTLGIYGYGKIGKIVAGFGKAFGMKVLVWGGAGSLERATADGFTTASSQAELFSTADVLSLHMRLSDTTRAIVGIDDLLRMKPTALFVNTANAELLQPEALVMALNRGRPGMAAIDVFESEPILQGHPLLRMENVICTPHIGYVERVNYERSFELAFNNVLDYIAGRYECIVNREQLQLAR